MTHTPATILCFTLSMPNNNSWNGKWSGEHNLYARTRRFETKKAKESADHILANSPYYYNFGDGWGASISVKSITGTAKRQIDKATKGFCGYDWMIDSIYYHGDIRIDQPRKAKGDL